MGDFKEKRCRVLALSAATALIHIVTFVVLSATNPVNLAVVAPLVICGNVMLFAWLVAAPPWFELWFNTQFTFPIRSFLFLMVTIINPFIGNLVLFANSNSLLAVQWFFASLTRPHAWIEFGSIGIALINPGKWPFRTLMAVGVPILVLAGFLEFHLLLA